MTYDKSLERLRADISEIWESQGWQDFRDIRSQDWDATLFRHKDHELRLLMNRYGVSANVMSPVVEQTLNEHMAVLLSNRSEIDAESHDKRQRAKDNVEDIRLSAAVSYRNQDKGRRFSSKTYADMLRYGISYWYKTWHMPDEPSYEGQHEDENLAGYAKRLLSERDAYFDQMDHQCFDREPISPLEMAHWPLEEPSVFLQKSIVPYNDVRGKLMQGRDRKSRFYMSKDKGILWGDSQPSEEVEPNHWNTYVTRWRRAKLDPDTGVWHVTEWISTGNTDTKDTDEVDDYECPFGRAPYFFAPGGAERIEEQSNPHLRYRPGIYPLIVKVDELNAYRSLLIKRTIWALEHPFAVTFYGTDAEVMRAVLAQHPEMGDGVYEGAGASGSLTWALPRPGSDEVMMVPRLDPVPQEDVQGLLASIEMVEREIGEMRVNRYLLGQGDINEPPATSVLDQHQAARSPYEAYHTSADLMREEWLRAEFYAMAKWGKEYRFRLSSDEPLKTAPSKEREPGDIVELTADKINYQPFMMRVATSNETDAERAMAEQSADRARELGAITEEQWLERRGNEDPRRQARDIKRDRRSKMMEPWEDAIFQQQVQTLFLAFSGLDLAQVGQQQGMLPQGAGGPTGAAPPTQPPSFGVNSGTAPVVQSPGSAEEPVV